VFKRALEAGASEEEKRAIDAILATTTMDCSVLTVLMSCSPSAWRNEVTIKIQKNELIAMLFPFRVRSLISQVVMRQSKAYIKKSLGLPYELPRINLTPANSMRVAMDLRDSYFSLNGLQVVNHTVPDYFVALAPAQVGSMGVMRVEVEVPKTRCHDKAKHGCYDNYYDGTDHKGRLKVKSSESPLQVLKETGAVTSIVHRYIAQGVALAGLVAMKGGDSNKLWLLFISMWGNGTRLNSVNARVSYKEGVSTKRLDPRTAVKNHKPQLFPNSTGCVKIYGAPLAQYLDRASCIVDYMGFMTAARVVGIVCAAAHKRGKIELWFATAPDALYPTNPITWRVAIGLHSPI